jgi:hypothetical protein
MLKHYVSIILMFAGILCFQCTANAGEAKYDDIKNAALQGVTSLLKGGHGGQLQHLGFESQDDIDNAELGEGFQIFTIQPAALLNESASQSFQQMVTPTNQWQFLIVARGNPKALLTVDLVDGKWTPVSIGSKDLAKELSGFLTAWPGASGYHIRFVRVHQAQSEFIELSQGEKLLGVHPLASFVAASKGGANGSPNPQNLLAPDDVLSSLQPTVRRNIQQKP